MTAGLTYMDGVVPYPPEVIDEYVRRGWWPDETFLDLFDRGVHRHPDREALVDDHRRLTWSELEREVTALAAALRERGLRKYDRVVLQLPNRTEYVVAFYAVQHVSAVPIPAVPRLGPAELRSLVELTEPAAWFFPLRDASRDFGPIVEALRQGRLLPRLSVAVGSGAPVPEGAVAYAELSEGRGTPRPYDGAQCRPNPNDVAVVFLTGGATGRSKLVPRTHNSFLGNAATIAANGSPSNTYAVCTPVAHGMANQGPLVGWMIHSARLVLVGSTRPRAILEAVSRERVTSLGIVPAQLSDLLDHPELDRYQLSSLRVLATTSAHLDMDLARRAQRFCDSHGIRFGGSAFGCTEGPSIGHLPGESLDQLVQTVGRPTVPGHRWIVLDPEGGEQPEGEVGELAVRGPSVFTGYYKAPEDTARIFTDSGYFRTGDQGFIDAEGYVHVTGRLKDIIQRGGEAVVPSEIEDLVVEHPTVSRVAVVAMPDPRLGERACAYVVLKPGARLTLEDLVDYLRSRGAGPLHWPERLETVAALPQTAAGKLDRVALRADIAQKVGEP